MLTDRGTAALIIATALACLGMGLCASRATGAAVIGEPPTPPQIAAPRLGEWLGAYAGPDRFAKSGATFETLGATGETLLLIPARTAEASAIAGAVFERERTLPQPRTLRMRVTYSASEPAPASEIAAAILIRDDATLPAGRVAAGSVGGGRATAPWLRRAFDVAGRTVAADVHSQTGWAELVARSGVTAEPALAPFLSRDVPAIVLRVGTGGTHADLNTLSVPARLLMVLVDQLQTESALPPIGPDRFAFSTREYLTPGATRWFWIFPLVPLTVGTAARYALFTRRPEFAPALICAVRRLVWWVAPCVAGAAALPLLPGAGEAHLGWRHVLAWCMGVAVLTLFARRRLRRIPADEPAGLLGGALVLDLLWSTYLVALVLRPWGAGAWLSVPAVAWPWVTPARRLRLVRSALAWVSGALPAAYLLSRIPGGLPGRFAWLAQAAPPWGALFAGFAIAVGLRLGWWALRTPPGPPIYAIMPSEAATD